MTPDGLDALRVIYEQAIARTGSFTPEQLQAIMTDNEELGAALHVQSLEAIQTQQGQRYGGDESRHSYVFPNQVGVMNLFGPIYPRANMMTMSGATSIAQFTKEFVAMYNDPEIKGIVMNIDSPGGDVRGIGDASQIIHGLSKKRKKPVKSYAEGLMASAAYWVGSSAQELWGSPFSSMTGSIGVVLKARAKGNGEYEIVSSQSPNKRPDPADEKGMAVLQQQVDDLASIFVDNVAQQRGVTPEKVIEKYGQGNVFAGPRAKTQGLLDKLGSLYDVVEAVAREAQSGSFKTKRKVSAEVEALLSFTSEENDMGLKNLVDNFRASTDDVFEATEEQAQSNAVTEESDESVAAEGQGQEEGETTTGASAPAIDPQAVQARRNELEDQFADKAELFASKMTLKHRILPAEQSHAASDLLIAMIDDAVVTGTVRFVSAEGEVVEGTREEAVRARYEARPKHSFTQAAIKGLKEGSVQGKVLAEEDTEKADEAAPVSTDRRKELLSQSELGRRAIASSNA
jgi:ClpP class serine protease